MGFIHCCDCVNFSNDTRARMTFDLKVHEFDVGFSRSDLARLNSLLPSTLETN